jgi:hypothetical protein
MQFRKIDAAIKTCKAHLDSLDDADPTTIEIETYLVSAIVLLIVSEYEGMIEGFFIERSNKCADLHVCNYVRTQISQKFRSPDLSKITELLGKFGRDYKDLFSNKTINTPAHAAWDNIMKARHAIVHNRGSLNITIREVVSSYARTKEIIDALRDTMGL